MVRGVWRHNQSIHKQSPNIRIELLSHNFFPFKYRGQSRGTNPPIDHIWSELSPDGSKHGLPINTYRNELWRMVYKVKRHPRHLLSKHPKLFFNEVFCYELSTCSKEPEGHSSAQARKIRLHIFFYPPLIFGWVALVHEGCRLNLKIIAPKWKQTDFKHDMGKWSNVAQTGKYD